MKTPPRLVCLATLSVALVSSAQAAPEGAELIKAIEKIVSADLDKQESASYAVGVVKDGQLVLAKGYGFADLENSVPATAETVYRLGSITKQFTALAILQLAEQGKLSIDDKLTKFLPEFPGGDKFTVQHLLTHTSGIKSYTSRPDFRKLSRADFTHEEMLALFKDEPLDFEPGTKWQYNNSGYYLLGIIIEKASGQKYADYLRKNVFEPLGMTATRYGDLRPIIPRRAMGYTRSSGALVNDEPMGMTAPGAAGALVSTVLDLIKWHQALETGRLLSKESYDKMYQPTKLADGTPQPYGYGWFLNKLGDHAKIGHGGGINGFSTMIGRYPDDRLAVIVLANTAGANSGEIEEQIARLMLDVEETPIADLPVEPALVEQLVGTYQFNGQPFEITADEGKLHGKPGQQSRDRLRYQGGRKFVPMRNGRLTITFTPADGPATGFEMDMSGFKTFGKREEKTEAAAPAE